MDKELIKMIIAQQVVILKRPTPIIRLPMRL